MPKIPPKGKPLASGPDQPFSDIPRQTEVWNSGQQSKNQQFGEQHGRAPFS
jgi:hypothetical protein